MVRYWYLSVPAAPQWQTPVAGGCQPVPELPQPYPSVVSVGGGLAQTQCQWAVSPPPYSAVTTTGACDFVSGAKASAPPTH